jgi:hypothetical protein
VRIRKKSAFDKRLDMFVADLAAGLWQRDGNVPAWRVYKYFGISRGRFNAAVLRARTTA